MVQITKKKRKKPYSSLAQTFQLMQQQYSHHWCISKPVTDACTIAFEGVISVTARVLMQVKKSGNHIMLLLSNEETDRYYTSLKMALSKENANLKLLPLKPRLIELQKGKNGYGFYLRMEQNTGGKNQANTQATTFAIQFIPLFLYSLQTSFSLSGFLTSLYQGNCLNLKCNFNNSFYHTKYH